MTWRPATWVHGMVRWSQRYYQPGIEPLGAFARVPSLIADDTSWDSRAVEFVIASDVHDWSMVRQRASKLQTAIASMDVASEDCNVRVNVRCVEVGKLDMEITQYVDSQIRSISFIERRGSPRRRFDCLANQTGSETKSLCSETSRSYPGCHRHFVSSCRSVAALER